jgi:Gas vesicle synthesis protein GvpO
MAERRRSRSGTADDSHPGGGRAGRDRPEAALRTREPGSAGDDEYAPAGDELEPPEEYKDEDEWDDLEPAAGDGDRPAGDGYEAEEDEPEPARANRPVARGSRDTRGRRAPRGGPVRTARQAVEAALRQVMGLSGKQAESITDVERREDGWMIGIEVVEDHRIPSSADILASYEATVDQDGELIAYRRLSRYIRGRSDGVGRS